MDVVLVGRRKAPLVDVARSARARGVTALPIACDVGDRNGVVRIAEKTQDVFGDVDLLCLNAGTSTAGPLAEHSVEDWDWVYRVVLMGVVHGVQAFLPAMTEAKTGHILITGSQAGLVPDGYLWHGPYTSAKAAVTALAMTLRTELEPSGIGVSLLVPAATRTDLAHTGAFPGFDRTAPDLSLITPRQGLPDPLPGFKDLLEPEEVVRRALAGVERNLPIIATHPGQLPIVEEYCSRITSAYLQDWSHLSDENVRC